MSFSLINTQTRDISFGGKKKNKNKNKQGQEQTDAEEAG
jgi:hypothetical protein